MHWVLQLFGNKVIERFSLTSQDEHSNSLRTHLVFSTLFLNNKKIEMSPLCLTWQI